MFVSKARFEEMKARAELAEQRLYETLKERYLHAQAETRVEVSPTRPLTPVEQRELQPLPPVVEDAILQRVPAGSDIAAALAETARGAMERMGPDFDAEAYAANIMLGTRVRGWPL